MESDTLPLIAFAEKIGVDPLTVRRWVWTGLRGGAVKLACVRIGVKVFVRWGDYLDFQRRFNEWKPKRVEINIPSSRARRRSLAEADRILASRGLG